MEELSISQQTHHCPICDSILEPTGPQYSIDQLFDLWKPTLFTPETIELTGLKANIPNYTPVQTANWIFSSLKSSGHPNFMSKTITSIIHKMLKMYLPILMINGNSMRRRKMSRVFNQLLKLDAVTVHF